MTPFETYKTYLALKMHFTTDSYDIFKYEGKVNASEAAYEKRKDKWVFNKLSKQKEPFDIILANMIKNPKMWIGTIADLEGITNYQQWRKKKESLVYSVVQEAIDNLHEDFVNNFKINDGQHSEILKLYLSNKISLEALIILLDITGVLEYTNERLSEDIIWQQIYKLIIKYKPFLEYEKSRVKNLIKDQNFFDDLPF